MTRFILAMPGFLCHSGELPVPGGLALHCIAILNTESIIDTDQTGFVISGQSAPLFISIVNTHRVRYFQNTVT